MVYMKSNRLFIKTKNKKIEYMQDKILELLFIFSEYFLFKKGKLLFHVSKITVIVIAPNILFNNC